MGAERRPNCIVLRLKVLKKRDGDDVSTACSAGWAVRRACRSSLVSVIAVAARAPEPASI
jgi:hypothetical protein